MSEALDAVVAAIQAKTRPLSATIKLSARCFEVALETLRPDENLEPLAPDYPERWLAGQWIASFEAMPAMEHASPLIQGKLVLHLQGVAATMKALNLPFWHLFQELSSKLWSDMLEITELHQQRAALQEKEQGNESMH